MRFLLRFVLVVKYLVSAGLSLLILSVFLSLSPPKCESSSLHLLGRLNISLGHHSREEVLGRVVGVEPGGRFKPEGCQAEQKVTEIHGFSFQNHSP